MSNPTELPKLDACPFCKGGNIQIRSGKALAYAYCDSCQADGPLCDTEHNAAAAWDRRAQPEGEAPQAEPAKEKIQRLAELHFYEGDAATMDIRLHRFAAALIAHVQSAATLSPLCGAQHAESCKEAVATPDLRTETERYNEWAWKGEPGREPIGLMHGSDAARAAWMARAALAAKQAAAPGALPGRIISATPGMGIIEVKIDHGFLPEWLDPGYQVRVGPAATSAPGTPEAPQPPFPVSDDEMAALRRFWECASDGEGYDVEKTMMQRLAEMGLVQRKSGAYYMVTEFGLYVLREYTVKRAAQLDGGQEASAT